MAKTPEIDRERLKALADEQLDELELHLRVKIAEVKGKIEHAMSKVHSEGEYSDPHWFSRAKAAARSLGIQHQMLLMEKSRRKRERHAACMDGLPEPEYARVFMNAAREILSPEMFKAIRILADERFKGAPEWTDPSSENPIIYGEFLTPKTNKDLQDKEPEDFDFSE